MKGTWTIAKRELLSLFNSPAAYIFITGFLVTEACMFFFVGNFFALGQASMRGYFSVMPFVFAALVPAVTMRLWADEKRQGTYELLLTLPFSAAELVLGKYIATMAVILIALALTLPVPVCVSLFGTLDAGVIAAEYAGAVCMASAAAALGQAVSAGAKNQMSAFILTVLILLALSLVPLVIAAYELPAFIADIVLWLSISHHVSGFSRGIIDTRDAAWFMLASCAGLFAAAAAIERGKLV